MEEAVERIRERLAVGGLVRYVVSLDALLSKDAERCTKEIGEALKHYHCGPEERFYLGRQLVQVGLAEEGFELIEESVRRGYSVAGALRSDPWLEPVRGLAAFRTLIELAEKDSLKARNSFEAEGGSAMLRQ